MEKAYKNKSSWFTLADAIIVLTVIGLIVAAVVLFLFPADTEDQVETQTVTLDLTMEKDCEEILELIKPGDKIYNGEVEIGKVQYVKINERYVLAEISLEKDEGIYKYNGAPLLINSKFVLETRLCSLDATVSGIKGVQK